MQKNQKRKICSYYARGKCVKEDCPFLHKQQTKKPCKFWTETGYCRKGKNCEFYHATKVEEKKDKKFLEKRDDEGEQKIERNFVGVEKQEQKKKQLQDTTQAQNTPPTQQPQPQVNHHANLQLQEQLLQQLQAQTSITPLQFFKLYPKTFPDHSKTLQSKEHIKQLQQRYFTQKPFLQLLKQLKTKEQQQYYQIIRRYQDSFRLVEEGQPKVYMINMRPLLFNKEISLHFVFEESFVMFKIDQRKYPEEKSVFEILNESIPEPYKIKFIDLLNKYHLKNSVFDTLKFFQNCFEKNYQTVKFKLENQHFKKVELKQKIQQGKEKIKQLEEEKLQQKREQQRQKQRDTQQHHKKQQKNNHHPKNHHKNQDQHQPPQQVHHPKQYRQQPNPLIKPKTTLQPVQNQKPKRQFRDYYQLQFNQLQKPQHQNLNDQITVQSLVMQNCPYLVIQKILLYIECNCSKVLMFLFDAQEKKQLKLWLKLKCKKCNDCVRIVWQRQVIHNKGQLISRMSFANGKLIDIGGIGWKIGCNCDAEILKPKLYLPGERLQLNCHQCFANMNVTYNGIKHFNPFVKQFQLQEDKELPLKGACNHDKLSFRWLRYACCGRPFACDQCHDLGAVKQHEITNGLTMICGYCAYQQHVTDQCAKCKKDLLKGQDKAGHWQGGLGCRDQQLLSKKDAKKYAGMGKVESHTKKKKEK